MCVAHYSCTSKKERSVPVAKVPIKLPESIIWHTAIHAPKHLESTAVLEPAAALRVPASMAKCRMFYTAPGLVSTFPSSFLGTKHDICFLTLPLPPTPQNHLFMPHLFLSGIPPVPMSFTLRPCQHTICKYESHLPSHPTPFLSLFDPLHICPDTCFYTVHLFVLPELTYLDYLYSLSGDWPYPGKLPCTTRRERQYSPRLASFPRTHKQWTPASCQDQLPPASSSGPLQCRGQQALSKR